MVIDLINYALDQNHQTFSIEETDSQLLTLTIKNKKYIIYYNDIVNASTSRNKDEIKISLSVSIKHKLIGYSAEDYNIIIIGYDTKTNTFTFWKYDNNFETNTNQSLYTKKTIIERAALEGYASHYIKKREAFNNKRNNQISNSISCNSFLFPLVLKYYSKIFDKNYLENFDEKIKRFNLPYSKDDLLLSLNLYAQDRATKNIDKNDPQLKEVSKLCNLRFKILGFKPLNQFIPEEFVNKFRNINGIYTKIQNFKYTDPNETGGYPGGAHEPQKKIWEFYFQNNQINKKKLKQDADELVNRILSKNIEILIGKIKTKNSKKIDNQIKNVFIAEAEKNNLQDIDINKEYRNRIINPDNFTDKIDSLNQLDRSNELHEKTLKKLTAFFKNKNLPTKNSFHIDFYTEESDKGYLFEIKTFNKSNFNQQIRHGIIQLKEYHFAYVKFWKIILKNTHLYLLVDKNPKEYIKDIQIEFLNSQNIKLCWFENEKIISLNEEILFQL